MVTKSAPDTILLKNASDSNRRNDIQANGTITPGDLIERDSVNSNRAKDVFEGTRHSTSDVKTAPLVALEYAKTGRGIDDDYSDGDHIEYVVAQPGDQFYMFVAPADELTTSGNANISVGDTLVSAGGAGTDSQGTLRKGGTRGAELFEALEAVDNSSPGTATAARIKVEAI